MGNTPNFDTDKLLAEATQLRDALAVHAGRLAVKAADLAEQGVDWAAPRAQAVLANAIEKATPVVEGAADRAQAAVDRARPAIEHARADFVEDYLPRLNRAVSEGGAALSAAGPLVERARRAGAASQLALVTPTRKVRTKRRFLRAIAWTAVAGTVAGAGYVLWKRSQPIEDPWAEEYWADLDTESPMPDMPAEEVEGVEQAPLDSES